MRAPKIAELARAERKRSLKMKQVPLFTIIVPVYKVENYLDKCVRSIINQTYRDIEIILVDDGSPDSCPAMCDSYSMEDERVRVIHKENGGLSDARNAGINAASGKYIIFVDSDDYIAPDTCERLLPFTHNDCDVIIGDGVTEGGKRNMSHGNIVGCLTGKEYLKAALSQGMMPLAAVLYICRRDFLNENDLRFKFGITHEDVQFTPRIFLLAERVIETGVCFYHYMVRDGSITTGKDMRKNGQDLYETCEELKRIFDGLEDRELKRLLLDCLVVNYLSLFQTGQLYRYGRKYIHKSFIFGNAYFPKTKLKAFLYCLSPRLYWHINDMVKRTGNR